MQLQKLTGEVIVHVIMASVAAGLWFIQPIHALYRFVEILMAHLAHVQHLQDALDQWLRFQVL
jgi:hypothetical protein